MKPSHANTRAPVQDLSLDLQDLRVAHLPQSSCLSGCSCTGKAMIHLHTEFHLPLKSTLNPSHQQGPQEATSSQFVAVVKGKVMRRPPARDTLALPCQLTLRRSPKPLLLAPKGGSTVCNTASLLYSGQVLVCHHRASCPSQGRAHGRRAARFSTG